MISADWAGRDFGFGVSVNASVEGAFGASGGRVGTMVVAASAAGEPMTGMSSMASLIAAKGSIPKVSCGDDRGGTIEEAHEVVEGLNGIIKGGIDIH